MTLRKYCFITSVAVLWLTNLFAETFPEDSTATLPINAEESALSETAVTNAALRDTLAVDSSTNAVAASFAIPPQDTVLKTPMQNANLQTINNSSVYSVNQNADFKEASIKETSIAEIPQNSRKSYIHNAFYFSVYLGARYLNLSNTEYDNSYDYIKDEYHIGDEGNSASKKFSGFGPDMGVKIGGLVASRAAFFCNIELASVYGEFSAKRTKDGVSKSRAKFDSRGIRFALGAGSHFYLNPNPESALYGVFFGASASILAEQVGLDSYDELEISDSGVSLSGEIGKVWALDEAWNIGLTAKVAMDGDFVDSEDSVNNGYSIGLGLTIIKK